MDLPKYLITGCQYKICDSYPQGEKLSPEEYFCKHPQKWENIYTQKMSRLNIIGESGNFTVGSLETFPFDHATFFEDNGYSLIESIGFTGGCSYTIVRNAG